MRGWIITDLPQIWTYPRYAYKQLLFLFSASCSPAFQNKTADKISSRQTHTHTHTQTRPITIDVPMGHLIIHTLKGYTLMYANYNLTSSPFHMLEVDLFHLYKIMYLLARVMNADKDIILLSISVWKHNWIFLLSLWFLAKRTIQ